MMAPAHSLSGAAVGLALAYTMPGLSWQVQLVTVAVCCGAALLPDLDHPGATASRSLWAVTGVLSKAIGGLSKWTYAASRGPRDRKPPVSGHRKLTHTLPGCLLLGAAVAGITATGRWPAFAVLWLLVALGAAGAPAVGRKFVVAVGAVLALQVPEAAAQWPWWGVVTTVGCVVHVVGDAITTAGVPLLWPVLRHGRRWENRNLVLPTFDAGSWPEKWIITPVLGVLCVAGAWAVFGGAV